MSSITLKAGLESMSYLRSLRRGSEIAARILEVRGPRTAVIEMDGRRVEAEFHEGLPETDSFTLSLKEKSGTSFVFRMRPRGNAAEALRELAALTVLGKGTAGLQSLAGALKGLTVGNGGIFDLNLALLRRLRGEGNSAFSTLVRLGFSPESAGDFLLLALAKRLGPLAAVLAARNPALMAAENEEERAQSVLNRLLQDVDTVTGAGGDEAFLAVMDCLKDDGSRDGCYHDFEYQGEEGAARVLVADGNVIVEMRYSALGTVTVLARQDEGIAITIFAESGEALEALEGERKALTTGLNAGGGAARVEYRLAGEGRNKMIEIINQGLVYSSLDVMV